MQLKDIRATVADDLQQVDEEIRRQLVSDVALVSLHGGWTSRHGAFVDGFGLSQASVSR